MHLNSLVAASLLSTATALPKALQRRVDDTCTDKSGERFYAATIGVYSDVDCLTPVEGYGPLCEYTDQDPNNAGDGNTCLDGDDLPLMSGYYARLERWANDDIQVLFTRDEACAADGPGGVFVTLGNSQTCVKINLGNTQGGLVIYPGGGSDLPPTRRDVANEEIREPAIEKREPPICRGFVTDSQEDGYSDSKQISVIVDCLNGDSACSINEGDQHTETFTSSFSVEAGGGVMGIDIGASFGVEYSESTSTSIQVDQSVEAGQRGYLSSYVDGTTFYGHFTECTDKMDRPGSTYAVKSDAGAVHYLIINE